MSLRDTGELSWKTVQTLKQNKISPNLNKTLYGVSRKQTEYLESTLAKKKKYPGSHNFTGKFLESKVAGNKLLLYKYKG